MNGQSPKNGKPIKVYRVGDKVIRVINTKPTINIERKNISIIGTYTTSDVITNLVNTPISRYGDVFCYHQNPWSILPKDKLPKISHFYVNSEEGIGQLEQHRGCFVNVISTRDFINKYSLSNRKEELKIVNVIPIEIFFEIAPIPFSHIKNRILTVNEIHELTYAIAMTFNKTHVYHFDILENGGSYEKPKQHVIIGELHSYWANNPEHHDKFREFFAPVVLIQQYYVPKISARRKEINYCMKKNIHSGLFDSIYLLNEKIYDKFDLRELENPIVKQVNIKKRASYFDIFKFAKENFDKHTYVILANSDIYLTNDIYKMFMINMNKTFLSLLRYDMKGDLYDKDYQEIHIFGPRDDSQDTWVFKVNDNLPIDPAMTFNMGVRGCDNAINTIMLRHKYRVLNPALSIKTVHVHMTEHRTYSQHELVYQPFYTMVKPHGIFPLKEVDGTNHWIYQSESNKKYIQEYPHYSQEIRTFMHYANKKHGVSPEFGKELECMQYPFNNVYGFQNVFCDNAGFVYNRDSYFTTHPTQFIKDINILQKTNIYKEVVMLCQEGDNTKKDASGLFWFLKSTLGRLLHLCSSSLRDKKFILNINHEQLKYINATGLQLQLVKGMDDQLYFANSMYVPMPAQELNFPRERIETFRKVYNIDDWDEDEIEEGSNINVLIVRDMEFHDTEERWKAFQDAVKESVLIYTTNRVNITYNTVEDRESNYFESVDKFKEARFVFGHRCEIMANVLFCRKGTHVIECLYESTPDLQLWNICASAEHKYTLIAYKREPKDRQCFMVCKKLKQAFDKEKYENKFGEFPIEEKRECEIFDEETMDMNNCNIKLDVKDYEFKLSVSDNIHQEEIVQKLISILSHCDRKGLINLSTNISPNNDNNDNNIRMEFGNKNASLNIEDIPGIITEPILFENNNSENVLADDLQPTPENQEKPNKHSIVLKWKKEDIRNLTFIYINDIDWNTLYYSMSLGVIPVLSSKWKDNIIVEKLQSLEIKIGYNVFYLSDDVNIEDDMNEIDIAIGLLPEHNSLQDDNIILMLTKENRSWSMNHISTFYIWSLIRDFLK
jgi:hypothetical protein